MPASSYRVLGDVWRVPLRLDAPLVDSSLEPAVTVELTSSDSAVSFSAPPEASWIAGAVRDGSGYAMFRDEAGVVTWYPGLGQVRFSPDLRSVVVTAERNTEATWALLLAASVPAQRALLLAELCLHASAFDRAGAAIALVGVSGSGKSTLVSHAADHGFEPLSDDAVRVGWHEGRPQFVGGSCSLRLRPGSAEREPAEGRWTLTADGRRARGFPATESRPLSWLVLLSPGETQLAVRGLPPATSLMRLVAMGDRVLQVRAPELVRARFAQWSQLVRTTRVIELTFPTDGASAGVEVTFRLLERTLVAASGELHNVSFPA